MGQVMVHNFVQFCSYIRVFRLTTMQTQLHATNFQTCCIGNHSSMFHLTNFERHCEIRFGPGHCPFIANILSALDIYRMHAGQQHSSHEEASHRVAKLDFTTEMQSIYRDRLKCLYVVARSLILLLLTCSAWLWLGPAYQDFTTLMKSIYELFEMCLSGKSLSHPYPYPTPARPSINQQRQWGNGPTDSRVSPSPRTINVLRHNTCGWKAS